jgi:hypothetical protein
MRIRCGGWHEVVACCFCLFVALCIVSPFFSLRFCGSNQLPAHFRKGWDIIKNTQLVLMNQSSDFFDDESSTDSKQTKVKKRSGFHGFGIFCFIFLYSCQKYNIDCGWRYTHTQTYHYTSSSICVFVYLYYIFLTLTLTLTLTHTLSICVMGWWNLCGVVNSSKDFIP